MRLKSFYAKTTTEAMRMVRQTLGEDAVIVATREEKGGTVCVTAAVDRPDAAAGGYAESDADIRDWLHGDAPDAESAMLERLTDVMIRHGVPEEITDQVLSCATVVGMERPGVALVAALEHLFSFRPLPRKPGAPACMVVGPPGAGKTLAVAKLAARDVMDNLDVAVISTDTVRAGGIEQLSAFTRLMKIDLKKATDAAQLREALKRCATADRVYIDTAGLSPFDPDTARETARLIAAGDVTPVLALPAGMDAQESGEIARIYGALGVNALLPTRIDIARRLGGLLSAAHEGSLIFAEAGNTPKVANGLLPLSPERLADLLMPGAAGESGETQIRTGRKQLVGAG